MALNQSVHQDSLVQTKTSRVYHKAICSFSPRLIRKFCSSIRVNTSGCWLWTKCKNSHGYGEFFPGGRTGFYAHRVAYTWFIGEIPQRKLVCHLCDVKSCCNPHHLFIGTQTDNMRDAVKKGLMHKGESSGQSKLNLKQVTEIRTKYRPYEYGYKKLGKEYSVTWSNIRAIIKGHTWHHVY